MSAGDKVVLAACIIRCCACLCSLVSNLDHDLALAIFLQMADYVLDLLVALKL